MESNFNKQNEYQQNQQQPQKQQKVNNQIQDFLFFDEDEFENLDLLDKPIQLKKSFSVIPCDQCGKNVLFTDYMKHMESCQVQVFNKNKNQEDCLICYETVQPGEAITLKNCGHGFFCLNCVKEHIINIMKEGAIFVKCCTEDCQKEISQREIKEIVGEQVFNKLDKQALHMVISTDPTLHHCPTPDCQFLVSWKGPEEGPPYFSCPLCKKEYCIACLAQPYHKAMNCLQYKQKQEKQKLERQKQKQEKDQWLKDIESEDKQDQFTKDYLAKSNIRVCARCGNGVVKGAGCNKMMCRCGFRFCYECGSENAQCEHTPSSHGFINNLTGAGDFTNLRDKTSPT